MVAELFKVHPLTVTRWAASLMGQVDRICAAS
jgi:hypothetical protein